MYLDTQTYTVRMDFDDGRTHPNLHQKGFTVNCFSHFHCRIVNYFKTHAITFGSGIVFCSLTKMSTKLNIRKKIGNFAAKSKSKKQILAISKNQRTLDSFVEKTQAKKKKYCEDLENRIQHGNN